MSKNAEICPPQFLFQRGSFKKSCFFYLGQKPKDSQLATANPKTAFIILKFESVTFKQITCR